ncbi:MAG: hypothetical protein E7588_03140 [Ruminococcaceae bacterium]|nr:hypothetical protein [Oscillospiraceae bacterium]
MKKHIALWQFAGFAVTSFLGSILHFLYDWTNENTLSALISAVNESTWEHMKILFFPMFIFALIQRRFFKKAENYWCIKLIGTSIGLILIPVLFYTLNGIFGPTPDWVNITIFFVSAATSYILEAILFKADKPQCPFNRTAFLLLCLIGALFIIFTFYPPQILLFRDPLTGTYGING